MTTPDDYRAFFNTDDPQRWGRTEMPTQRRETASWLRSTAFATDARILEVGCGMGVLSDVHPGWVGADFSLPALRRVEKGRPVMQADMQRLPVRADSVDFLFSWAAIEHVPSPELAMQEIERVLKPGGVALLAPAWNVRAWASKALPVRPFHELSAPDALHKLAIPILNNVVWRAAVAMPRRLRREALLFLGRPVAFEYRRLTPNLTSYAYTDSDAFASMDSHAAITYFASRHWEVLSHRGVLRRLRARAEPVVVRKPR